MRLSELISAVRAEVNDPSSKYWTDVQVTRWVNHWTRALFRQRVQADPSYSMQALQITGSDATRVRQVADKRWAYHLPSWAFRVRQVRITSAATEPENARIVPLLTQRDGSGWRFEGSRRLDLAGFEAEDLTILVAKTPALVHQGTVRKASAAANELYVDHLHSYPEDRELGAYVGAQFELTGVADASRDPRGSVAEVISAAPEWDAGLSAWLVKVAVMPHFPVAPALNDTYEMHPEVDDAHSMYLILLAARSLLQEHNNKERLMQIEPLIASQRADFIDGLRPRQDLQPSVVSSPFDGNPTFDADRDWSFDLYYGW